MVIRPGIRCASIAVFSASLGIFCNDGDKYQSMLSSSSIYCLN